MSQYDSNVYYTIPYLDELGINTNGNIIVRKTRRVVNEIIENGHRFIIYNNEKHPIIKLMLQTFVGPLPGTIYWKDDDAMNCRTDNIGYITNIIYSDDMKSVTINGELFKLAAHYDTRYYISAYGVLYDRNYGIRPHSFSQRDYWSVVINEGFDNRSKRMISKWVYETWVGPIPDGYEIDHKDGKHWNNHYSNLEAVTGFENIQRSYDVTHVKTRRWEKSQVEEVCKMMEKNYSITEIRDALGLSNKEGYKLVSSLTRGLTTGRLHRDVSVKYNISDYHSVDKNSPEGNRAMTFDEVKEVIRLHKLGKSNNEIAKMFHTTHSVVYGITCGRSYKRFLKLINEEEKNEF